MELYDEKKHKEANSLNGGIGIFTLLLLLTGLGFLMQTTQDQKNFIEFIKIDEKTFFPLACKMKETCNDFRTIRKTCANAGTIDECIKIRSDNQSYLDLCTANGESNFPSNVTPNWAQCFRVEIDSLANSAYK